MADVKVSALPVLAAGDLDLVNDMIMVVDVSAGQSKRMPPGELLRAAAPYLSTAWDFTTGSLLPTVSFARASTGWRYNSAGVLVPATTDVARFQYDPATLARRGLLVEADSTELFTYSEQFDNAAWTKARCAFTANAIAAPDGTTTADKMVEDAVAAQTRYAAQVISFVAGTTYVMSVFAKADTRSWMYFQFPAAAFTSNLRTWFNASTGAIGTTPAGVTAFAQNVGGGWYRFTVIATATITTSTSVLIAMSPSDATLNYDGDGVSGMYFWGANIQADDRVTSYVKAEGSTVVRSADLAFITNPQAIADQCWIIRARTPRKTATSATNTLLQLDDGGSQNRRQLYYGADSTLRLATLVGNVTQCSINLGAYAADTDFTVAIRFAENNFAASLNGGAIVTDLSGTNPIGLTTARIGRGATGAYWNSTIRTIETRRTATDTELPLLSA